MLKNSAKNNDGIMRGVVSGVAVSALMLASVLGVLALLTAGEKIEIIGRGTVTALSLISGITGGLSGSKLNGSRVLITGTLSGIIDSVILFAFYAVTEARLGSADACALNSVMLITGGISGSIIYASCKTKKKKY